MCDPRCRIHHREAYSPAFWAMYDRYTLILLEVELLEHIDALEDSEPLLWFMEADA